MKGCEQSTREQTTDKRIRTKLHVTISSVKFVLPLFEILWCCYSKFDQAGIMFFDENVKSEQKCCWDNCDNSGSGSSVAQIKLYAVATLSQL